MLLQVVLLFGHSAHAQYPSNETSPPQPADAGRAASAAPAAAAAAPVTAATPPAAASPAPAAAAAAATAPESNGNNCPEWSFIDNRQPLIGIAQANRPKPPSYTANENNSLVVLDARRYLFEPLYEAEMLRGKEGGWACFNTTGH